MEHLFEKQSNPRDCVVVLISVFIDSVLLEISSAVSESVLKVKFYLIYL